MSDRILDWLFAVASLLLLAAFALAILAVWDVAGHQDEWGGTAVLVGIVGVVVGAFAIAGTDQ